MDPIPDRYEKNPLLVILENYVLHTIGHLGPDKESLLAEIVETTFAKEPAKGPRAAKLGDWKKTIRRTFDLPENTDEVVRQLWQQRQEEASATQASLTPEDFARQTVDEMFADLTGENP